jgi:hypothetical protein
MLVGVPGNAYTVNVLAELVKQAVADFTDTTPLVNGLGNVTEILVPFDAPLITAPVGTVQT